MNMLDKRSVLRVISADMSERWCNMAYLKHFLSCSLEIGSLIKNSGDALARLLITWGATNDRFRRRV